MKQLAMFTVMMLAATAAGCWERPAALAPAPQAAPTTQPRSEYLARTAVKPEPVLESPTAVDSALAWSERYSQAIEKLARLQQENADLQEKNRSIASQAVKHQAELAQAQKELNDANAMLVDIRGELEKWKASVLGFRQEMRSAQQAQLEALTKVLRVLGAEVQPTTRPAEKAAETKDVASGSR
jgi:septal ring factor EnvC (AmiA/AmiB activator)